MADRQISELVEAVAIEDNDLLVLQQGETAKKAKGKTVKDWVYNESVENFVIVSDTEPTTERNHIWVDPSEEDVVIPTMDDLQGLTAEDISYDGSATHTSGSVGEAISELSSDIDGLDAGDVEYDSSTTYGSGSVGAALATQSENIVALDDLTGAGINRFDARTISTTNATNWTLTNQTKTGITIVHNNSFAAGLPEADLNLPTGKYVFHADYTSSTSLLLLFVDNVYAQNLFDGAFFEVVNGKAYSIKLASSSAGTYTIADISIEKLSESNSVKSELMSALSDVETRQATVIRNSTIGADGIIYSNNNFDTWYASVYADEIIDFDTVDTAYYYAFYSSLPAVGSVSVDAQNHTGTRTGVSAPSNGYIVFRSSPTGLTSAQIKAYTGAKDVVARNSETALGLRMTAAETQLGMLVGDKIVDLTFEKIESTLLNSLGVITASLTEPKYFVRRTQVNPGDKIVQIYGCTNWKNVFYGFYDENLQLLSAGPQSNNTSTVTTYADGEATAPANAAYFYVSGYNTNECGAKKVDGQKPTIKKWSGLKWVCVGDSLTEVNSKTTMHYHDYIKDETGITVVNMGVSGTGYGKNTTGNENAFYHRISSVPTDADVITIFGSFNDLNAGMQAGSYDDTETTTLAGCINTTLDNLFALLPLANVGIVAPCPWEDTQPATSGAAFNYVDVMRQICEHRSIPFINLWTESGLRPWDANVRAAAYSKDGGEGCHPDETGHKILAPKFKAFLEKLLM